MATLLLDPSTTLTKKPVFVSSVHFAIRRFEEHMQCTIYTTALTTSVMKPVPTNPIASLTIHARLAFPFDRSIDSPTTIVFQAELN